MSRTRLFSPQFHATALALATLLGLTAPAASAATPSPASPPVVHGAMGGPTRTHGDVAAHGADVYRIYFEEDEPALIRVSGDGSTNLDCYVYDENGILVDADEDSTDECLVSWTPRWTGPFRVVIVNRGPVYNDYALETN